jgi:hypothetical protein
MSSSEVAAEVAAPPGAIDSKADAQLSSKSPHISNKKPKAAKSDVPAPGASADTKVVPDTQKSTKKKKATSPSKLGEPGDTSGDDAKALEEGDRPTSSSSAEKKKKKVKKKKKKADDAEDNLDAKGHGEGDVTADPSPQSEKKKKVKKKKDPTAAGPDSEAAKAGDMPPLAGEGKKLGLAEGPETLVESLKSPLGEHRNSTLKFITNEEGNELIPKFETPRPWEAESYVSLFKHADGRQLRHKRLLLQSEISEIGTLLKNGIDVPTDVKHPSQVFDPDAESVIDFAKYVFCASCFLAFLTCL